MAFGKFQSISQKKINWNPNLVCRNGLFLTKGGKNKGFKGILAEDHAYRLKSKIELLKTAIEKMILVKIDSNRNRKMFNF